jgi:hypothetical protein
MSQQRRLVLIALIVFVLDLDLYGRNEDPNHGQ